MSRLRRQSTQALSALVAVLALLLAAAPGTAWGQGSDPLQAVADSAYRLTTGDKISVSVFGHTDLTGEYLVDDSGRIGLAYAGAVAVADLTIKECETKITEHLAKGFVRHPSVNVRASELRPVYVVGDVRLAGAYPYRHGITVLSAIALAGGYSVAEAVPGTAAAEYLLIDERMRLLETTRLTLLVRQERLNAELRGVRLFVAPTLPEAHGSAAPFNVQRTLEAIAASEQQVLTARAEALEKEIAMQKGQKATLAAAISAVQTQKEGEKKQLKLLLEQAYNYAKLDPLGLTRKVETIRLEREKAALESMISKLDVDRAQLELMSGEVDNKMQALELAYSNRATADLQETRTKLLDVETSLPAVRELRSLRAQQVGGVAGAEATGAKRSLLVLRVRNSRVQRFEAMPEMLLQPGDIVEIQRTTTAALSRSAEPERRSGL